MKFYLFKEEELKLEFTDPTSFNKSHKEGTDYRVFQMIATVCNFQPSDDRDDPEQKQFCADLKKKLFQQVSSADVSKDRDNGAHGSANKKCRIDRNFTSTLKIVLGVPNIVKDGDESIIEIDGEFITTLHQMCLSLHKADVRVKLKLTTDLLSSPPDPICKRSNFSVTTNEMPINDKTDDYTEYCNFYFDMPDLVRNTIINSKDGKKMARIDGKFTIELSLKNFEESLVSLETLNHAILNEAESADVIIYTGDGKEVPCHRVFLAVSSVILKAMLRSSFKESSGRIEMPDMTEEGVRAFLAYLYNRNLASAKEKMSIVWELLNAGEKYNMIPLRTSMEKILLENDEDSWWMVEPALQIFAFVNKIDSDLKEDVKQKILKVMKRNHSEWMSSEVYQKMVKENPVLHSELLKSSFSLCSCELPDSDSDTDN